MLGSIRVLKGEWVSPNVVLLPSGEGRCVETAASYTDGGDVVVWVVQALSDNREVLFDVGGASGVVLVEELCRAPRVGVSTAARIVQFLGASGVVNALASGDHKALAKTPTVGAATAKGIIASCEVPDGVVIPDGAVVSSTDRSSAVSALVDLGFDEVSSREAVDSVAVEVGSGGSDLVQAAVDKLISAE